MLATLLALLSGCDGGLLEDPPEPELLISYEQFADRIVVSASAHGFAPESVGVRYQGGPVGRDSIEADAFPVMIRNLAGNYEIRFSAYALDSDGSMVLSETVGLPVSNPYAHAPSSSFVWTMQSMINGSNVIRLMDQTVWHVIDPNDVSRLSIWPMFGPTTATRLDEEVYRLQNASDSVPILVRYLGEMAVSGVSSSSMLFYLSSDGYLAVSGMDALTVAEYNRVTPIMWNSFDVLVAVKPALSIHYYTMEIINVDDDYSCVLARYEE